MLFLFFEEMKQVYHRKSYVNYDTYINIFMVQNLEDVIRRVAAFLGKTLSDDQVKTLLNNLSFENLSKLEKESGTLKTAVETGVMNDKGTFYRKGYFCI